MSAFAVSGACGGCIDELFTEECSENCGSILVAYVFGTDALRMA